MNPSRPKNLNLFTIRFPIPAIVSLFHRISGFALFFIVPIMLFALSFSLTESGFEVLRAWLSIFYIKFIFWVLLIPFCYHLVAGIRHLLMDIHVGSTLKGGRRSAYLTLVISILLILLAGVWLW